MYVRDKDKDLDIDIEHHTYLEWKNTGNSSQTLITAADVPINAQSK